MQETLPITSLKMRIILAACIQICQEGDDYYPVDLVSLVQSQEIIEDLKQLRNGFKMRFFLNQFLWKDPNDITDSWNLLIRTKLNKVLSLFDLKNYLSLLFISATQHKSFFE